VSIHPWLKRRLFPRKKFVTDGPRLAKPLRSPNKRFEWMQSGGLIFTRQQQIEPTRQ
jgi:hypothetical protein